MGEHSIITPESRVIVSGSGSRVVRGSSSSVGSVEGRGSSGDGVRRRGEGIGEQQPVTSGSRVRESVEIGEATLAGRTRDRRRNRQRSRTTRCGVIGNKSSSSGLLERVSLLFLTLFGIPITIGSSASRGTSAPLVSVRRRGEAIGEPQRVTTGSRLRESVEIGEATLAGRSRDRRRNRQRSRTTRRGTIGNKSSSSGLLERVSLLFLTLFGIPITFGSSASRGTSAPLVSGSCALVSLLVVGLLRPSMAVPATGAVTGNDLLGEIGGGRGEPPLTRLDRHGVVAVDEVSVVEPTMDRRVRVLEEEPAANRAADDDDDDDDGEATTRMRQRESGLETRSRLGEAELDTIRRSIVEGLGLERIPDPSKANVSQTEYRRAHEEYLTRLQHSRTGEDARQRRLHTFHPAERLPVTLVNRTRRDAANFTSAVEPDHRRGSHFPTLYFPLEIPDEEARVDHATLRFLLDQSPVEEAIRDIYVYRRTADSWSLVSRQSVLPGERAPRWVELDVTELASAWHDGGDANYGLRLRFGSGNGAQPIVALPAMNVFTTNYSYGENDARLARRKRRAGPEHLMSLHKGRRTECRGENKKCCRHEMTVIFKDLKGFEFIVQPKNFDAGYCKGRCPPRYNPAHHHALLQSLIWKEDKRKAPRPCCAPSKLDELEILYFDENDPTKLKVSSWKNMKVLECACS